MNLVGPGSPLAALTKQVLESVLEAELDEHLGYEHGDRAGKANTEARNERNGTRGKTVHTELGPVTLEVPRDRDGSFEPVVVRKRQRRLDGVDEMVLSLAAKGLTTGEIADHFAQVYGQTMSKDTISRITDKVIAETVEWQNRHLDAAPSIRWCSSTPFTSRSATDRSPTGRSTSRSGSLSRGSATFWAFGPGTVAKAPNTGWPSSPS